MTVAWDKPYESVLVSVEGRTLALKVGDFIKFARVPLGVRIESFVGKDPVGPMGMEYLPWLGDKFAEPTLTLRGNPYFIVCWPVGRERYGQHIDWATVEMA